MTLQELFANVDGDYAAALTIMPTDELIDHCIRIFPEDGDGEALAAAGETMDPRQLFETAHAMKGACANLGLLRLSALASQITEEFRPGNPRTMSDEQVKETLKETGQLYQHTVDTIRRYAAEN